MAVTRSIVAECCFVDVAQGSANIILLGERRAIIIDCGPRQAFAPIRVLEYYGVETITALIVTHNDMDHCGGAELLLSRYRDAIDRVYFLEDRPSRKNFFLARVRQEIEREALDREQVRRLESDDVIYRDDQTGLVLQVMFPAMLDNIDALQSAVPNATSGVLHLRYGSRGVLFPGDVDEGGLRVLSNDGATPVECDVVAVPHHGGRLTTKDGPEAYQRIYEHSIRCKIAIVSIGSSNQHKHPLRDHVAGLRRAGVTVICTQITPRCCDNLEGLRPGVSRSALPGASSAAKQLTQAYRSKHVACAGSIMLAIGLDGVVVQGLTQHQTSVGRLERDGSGHPLCRAAIT